MNEIARCISKVRRECMVIIVFAASIGAAWGSVDTNPYVMTEPTIFTAAAGTTNVYSGLISGTGPAIIEGGGTSVPARARLPIARPGAQVARGVSRLRPEMGLEA